MNTQKLIIDCICVLMVMAFPLAAAVWGQDSEGAEETATECPMVKNPVWVNEDNAGCPRESGRVFYPSHGHGDTCKDCSGDAYDILRVNTGDE